VTTSHSATFFAFDEEPSHTDGYATRLRGQKLGICDKHERLAGLRNFAFGQNDARQPDELLPDGKRSARPSDRSTPISDSQSPWIRQRNGLLCRTVDVSPGLAFALRRSPDHHSHGE
jgi:hypothetical protein